MTGEMRRKVEEGEEGEGGGELEEEEFKSSSEDEQEELGRRFDIQEGKPGDDAGVDEDEGSIEEERQHLGPIGARRRFLNRKVVEQEDGEGAEEEEDDEANEDLSLLIVAKARKRQKVETRAADEGVVVFADGVERGPGDGPVDKLSREENSIAEEGGGQEPLSRSETPEEGELQEDGEGNLVLAADLFEVEDVPDGGKKRKEKKKEKKEKKKKKKGGDPEQNKGKPLGNEAKLVGAEESIVMRKLLRGPRYFDPPEEQDQSCFNCGKVGHLAVDCTEGPRLKPCYVCGAFGHDGRDCPQKTDCYVCGKVGHIARNCPNKGLRTSTSKGDEIICLFCGRFGHEKSTCYYDYEKQDLEQVQCYICKAFGHLSCVNIFDTSPVPVSCYLCGEMGHTAAECGRTRRPDREKDRDRDRPASNCFNCGEEGHFARDCRKRRESWPRPWPEETLFGGDFTTPASKHQRSNGGGPRWMDLQSREGRWTNPGRTHPLDPFANYRSLGTTSKRRDHPEDDQDYMGPLDNFIDNSKENVKSRRRKSWAAGGGRKRS